MAKPGSQMGTKSRAVLECLSKNPRLNLQGMTMRDYFAAKAMQTLLGSEFTSEHGLQEGWMTSLAHESYMVADAMLKAREA